MCVQNGSISYPQCLPECLSVYYDIININHQSQKSHLPLFESFNYYLRCTEGWELSIKCFLKNNFNWIEVNSVQFLLTNLTDN